MQVEKTEKRKLFGGRLRAARDRLGLTQVQLAQKMNVHSGLVAVWEIGRSIPRPATLQRLADLLGVTGQQLTGPDEAHPAETHDRPDRDLTTAATALARHIRRSIDEMIKAAGTDVGKLSTIIHRLQSEFPTSSEVNRVAFIPRRSIIPKSMVEEMVKQLGPHKRQQIEEAVAKMEVLLTNEEHADDGHDHSWTAES